MKVDVSTNDNNCRNDLIVTRSLCNSIGLKWNKKKEKGREHPFHRILRQHMEDPNVEPGWLRQNEAVSRRNEPPKGKHLTESERDLVFKIGSWMMRLGIAVDGSDPDLVGLYM